MTGEQLDYLILQHTGLTAEQHPEAHGKAYRLAFAVMATTVEEALIQQRREQIGSAIEVDIETMAPTAGEAAECELVVLIDEDDDPGNIPHYQAFQAIMDDMLDSFPPEVLDTLDTPEGRLLDCITEAMIRYETKYWPMDGDEQESRKDLPSPAGKGE